VADRPLEQRLSNPNHGCGCLPCGLGTRGTRGTTGPPEARIDPTPIGSWWLVAFADVVGIPAVGGLPDRWAASLGQVVRWEGPK
jgi:hypothetical protein